MSLRLQQDGGVARLLIDRADKRNAFFDAIQGIDFPLRRRLFLSF